MVLKKDITIWIKDQKKKDNEGYCNIDDNIKNILVISDDFILNEEEKLDIMDLEFRWSTLLIQEEMEWWLKIHALWEDLGWGTIILYFFIIFPLNKEPKFYMGTMWWIQECGKDPRASLGVGKGTF